MGAFISNLTNKLKSKQSYSYCKFVYESLFFDYKNTVKLCPFFEYGIMQENFDGIWFDISKFIQVRNACINDFKNNNIYENCKNCCYYKNQSDIDEKLPLKELHLYNWRHCYINCSYCSSPKEEDLLKAGHYDIFPIIKQLIENNIIDKKTKVIFECGDACIHPEFDKILFYFINYGMEKIVVNTPALRFCESVANAVSKNIIDVIIPIDAGCPYIYEKVKGINKFDIMISNVKKYLAYQEPSKRHIAFKYTIIGGINDNQKEILDWFIYSRDLGVKKLALDVEKNWFMQIKNTPPKYLMQLIQFAKDISFYNDIEIDFSERADFLYELISK